MVNYSNEHCLSHYGHWDKCLRDDNNKYGRNSFYVLCGIFSMFFLYGCFVSYKLFMSKSIKHNALYLFYALGMLTLFLRVLFFLDPIGSNGDGYLWPNSIYLILSSLPTYTYLLCGLSYQLLVLKVLLLTRKTILELSPKRTEKGQQTKEQKKSNCVIGFIWLVMFLCASTFCVNYCFEYGNAINNLNRIYILSWTVGVCLILALSSMSLIREMKKYYSTSNKHFKSARSRILMVLSVLVFSYLYRIAFYIWYQMPGDTDSGVAPEMTDAEEMRYMMIGTFMYIFGEGLPIVIIFTMHYHKFVYQPNKELCKNQETRRLSTKKSKSELETGSTGNLSYSDDDLSSGRMSQYEDVEDQQITPTLQRTTFNSVSDMGGKRETEIKVSRENSIPDKQSSGQLPTITLSDYKDFNSSSRMSKPQNTYVQSSADYSLVEQESQAIRDSVVLMRAKSVSPTLKNDKVKHMYHTSQDGVQQEINNTTADYSQGLQRSIFTDSRDPLLVNSLIEQQPSEGSGHSKYRSFTQDTQQVISPQKPSSPNFGRRPKPTCAISGILKKGVQRSYTDSSIRNTVV